MRTKIKTTTRIRLYILCILLTHVKTNKQKIKKQKYKIQI